jgi:hypothetical protein
MKAGDRVVIPGGSDWTGQRGTLLTLATRGDDIVKVRLESGYELGVFAYECKLVTNRPRKAGKGAKKSA